VANNKLILRNQVKAALAALSDDQLAKMSMSICTKLTSLSVYHHAKTVMLYAPMPREVDVAPVILHALSSGKVVVLPKVDWPSWSMQAAQINRYPQDLTLDGKGLFQPSGSNVILPEEIDLVIVPGLAFSPSGDRLGRGGGFYDRYLPMVPTDKRVGVCFSAQLLGTIPMHPTDQRVGMVVTDS
jgi:5-formyltetrahydrofolate cyclo-ligase